MNLAALVVATAAAAPLQGVLDEQRTTQDIAGVSAVVFGQGETLFLGASGVADLETGAVMTPDTRLYIGSVSKVLTAAVTLQLVESGQLDLDDEIPDIAQGTYAPVRIRHLLSHSSGLEREGDFGYWFDADFPTNSELADYLARAELRFAPGSDTRYSNIGYAALGLVISRSVSRSFDEALHAWLLEPLGMRSSGVTAPVAGMANGYTPPGRMLPSNERPFAGVGAPVGDRHVRMYHDAAAMAPAFGIYSTARDMGRLARFLIDGESEDILSASMRSLMRERHSGNRGLGLTLATFDGRPVVRHDGWFAAHRAYLLLDDKAGIAVVVLANGDNASPRRIAESLLRTTRGLLEDPPVETPADETPPDET
jgi:CubicO group peptidase (beta-lactamase class C family)